MPGWRNRINQMRPGLSNFVRASFLVIALVCAALAANDSDPVPAPATCGNGIPGGVNCIVSKKDQKDAREAYSRGVKLQEHQHWEEAFVQFDRASRMVPQNPEFLTAREVLKAQLVFDHVEHGNALMANNAQIGAAAEFRAALELDPENEFARERLDEATRDLFPLPANLSPTLGVVEEISLQPASERATFHYVGDVHGLFTELTAAYGVKVHFDDSVREHPVRFYVDNVDFSTALTLACKLSKTMWAALDAHQILIADEKPENHKQFDSMSLMTLQLPPHSTTTESTELVSALKTIFDLKLVSTGQTAGIVEVRAPTAILSACTRLWEQFNRERPQVMLDIRVFQIDHMLTRNIGLHTPDTFNLYNIPVAALAGLGGQNLQQLINQLIASGGINQANSTALSGLLSQLTGQQNSIFSQPLATFGGGLTFSGLSLDQLVASLSLNESWVRSLEHMTMRASDGNDATFHLGSRYPILNASYAPIFNSPQISQVLGNQTYIPPFPSVSYEDLGLNVKAKPMIHGNGDVSMALELQVRSLTGQSANGVPVISNREYKGSINLRDGEPAVVAGQVSRTDTRSLTGIPGFGILPGLNQVAVNNTAEHDLDELMIVITPHVLANTMRTSDEIWLSAK
jgi:general secretion pathway protein D